MAPNGLLLIISATDYLQWQHITSFIQCSPTSSTGWCFRHSCIRRRWAIYDRMHASGHGCNFGNVVGQTRGVGGFESVYESFSGGEYISNQHFSVVARCGKYAQVSEESSKNSDVDIMLSPLANRWDGSVSSGRVIETLDAHSDIIHIIYKPVWMFPM